MFCPSGSQYSKRVSHFPALSTDMCLSFRCRPFRCIECCFLPTAKLVRNRGKLVMLSTVSNAIHSGLSWTMAMSNSMCNYRMVCSSRMCKAQDRSCDLTEDVINVLASSGPTQSLAVPGLVSFSPFLRLYQCYCVEGEARRLIYLSKHPWPKLQHWC